MPVTNEMLDFLTGIHGNRDKDREARKQKIFDRAFSNAFGDMWTHTAEYTKKAYFDSDTIICRYNRAAVRETIKEYISCDFKEVKNLNGQSFAKWHENLCGKIVNIGTKQVGLLQNTQDNRNAASKKRKENRSIQAKSEYEYLSQIVREGRMECELFSISEIICHAKKDEMEKKQRLICTPFSYGQAQKLVNMMLKYLYIYCNCEGIHDLNQVVKYFHTPVDSYVLEAAFGKSVAEAWKDGKKYEIPWSQINSYDEYLRIQEGICEAVRKVGAYETAFEWELTEWPFSEKFA